MYWKLGFLICGFFTHKSGIMQILKHLEYVHIPFQDMISWFIDDFSFNPEICNKKMYNLFLLLDAPRCVSTQKMIYGVSEGETAYISCMIDAKPKPDQILWYMNTTSGRIFDTGCPTKHDNWWQVLNVFR